MPTIHRLPQLPDVPEVTCPAARPVAGAVASRCGVVCGVVENDLKREMGLGMTPRQLEVARGNDGDSFGTSLLTVASDPSSIREFCTGTMLPLVHASQYVNRASYTACPTWQAEKQRLWAERRQLTGGGTEDIMDEVMGR